ncbi:MAG: RimK domain-containing protein [Pseudonocardiales bacterium]|nr:RimK domain-containing protein [Pseudonocardiales bacterium]
MGVDARLRDGRWVGRLCSPHRDVELEDIDAVWYRAPAAFQLPAGLTVAERRHAHIEAKLGLGGVLLALRTRWVNRPDLSATACYKPLQLAAAARAGLTVADTLVTNTPDAVRSFVLEHDTGVITKMFASNSVVEDGGRKVAFTRPVTTADLADLAGIETTTHQFQARIAPKAFDARIVVIGSAMFGFAIHASTEAARLDFRRDYRALRYERIDVPAQVAAGVAVLMAEFGLAFAAIDFVVQPDGRWVFIGDVNPGGQYGWLEDTTDAPLTETLADLLAYGADT